MIITEYATSPIYLFFFFFLVGFFFHLIRNKEYKGTLLASIVIGFILGFVFNPINLEWIERILVAIVFVLLGGFVAVGLKKVLKGRKD